MAELQNQRLVRDDEINPIDYWRVIWKRRRLIGALFSASVIGALILGLLSPKIYESTATILGPQEGGAGVLSSLVAAGGIVQQLPGIAIPSLTPNRDVFMSILNSQAIAQNLVEQLKLKEYYKAPDIEGAINSLRGASNVSVSREGLISVKVEDTDPKMAAKVANAYPDELDRLMAKFGTGTAGRQHRFIAEQLEKTGKDLAAAEENLKLFQERNRAVAIGAQAQGAITMAAELKGQIIASEVQLQSLRGFATDSNPDVVRLRGTIGELKRQLAQAQYGAGLDLPPVASNSGRSEKEIYLPASRVPEVGLELARLTRDLKVQETVYTQLTQQLEQAKIAEAQDVPVVRILDKAVPPTNKSKPKIKLNMLIAGAFSLFLGIVVAFALEFVEKQKAALGKLES